MTSRIERTNLLPDKDKKKLTAYDFFDKVINLCFHIEHTDTGLFEDYILRSDYVADSYGNIHKCPYKPSIRISYHKINSSSAVSIDIIIDNFYIIDKANKIKRNFTKDSIKIHGIDIAMGYFPQFNKPVDIAGLFNFDNSIGQGVAIMKTRVFYSEAKGEMPNISTVIHCVMGNETVTPYKDKEEPDFTKLISTSSKQTQLTEILNEWIHDRFINESLISKSPEAMTIYNKQKDKLPKTLFAEYGIDVHVTEKVKSIKLPEIKDSDGNVVTDTAHIEPSGVSIANTLYKINRFFQCKLRYVTLLDGSILVYSSDEAEGIKTIAEEAENKVVEYSADSVFRNFWESKLPAIYSITIGGGTTTLTCPFVCFMQPFERIKFSTNYGNLSSSMSILNKPNATEFYIVGQTVEFSTVDEDNTMTLTGKTEGN